ncbi:hypothetical protein [Streptomyces sp. CBMA29]|uniref:hypothetical protein n=1 Tax=Streptomyces sp. CBMA29 TaxID=1896314 RepID=UPI00166209DD|nr:hypothetical protein [Streptomyces sp. CBMA29]MBD0736186.1 hypothetical protein [Streptomyces sp. CBMA29]
MCTPALAASQPRISLMAISELRDVLTALELGQGPTAVAGLMAIDPESWQAIEQRLAAVGGDLRTVLQAASLGAPVLPYLA